MNMPRKPAEVLREARQRDSRSKRARVFATVDELKQSGTPMTFSLVARVAGVSTWLVYAAGVREYIEAARTYQAAQPHRQQLTGVRASEQSLRTDLELTRQDNRALRAKVAHLTQSLRQQLGRQLDHQSTADLRTRIEELLDINRELQKAATTVARENQTLRDQLSQTEDDLIAVRASLRQMIRDSTNDVSSSSPRVDH